MVQRLAVIFTLLLNVVGCSSRDSSKEASAPSDSTIAAAVASMSFINRIWVVSESKQVTPGERRVFMSDGTLLMSSPNSDPAYGAWRYEAGNLIVTEDGQEYRWEILEINESSLRVRGHGRGEPMEIVFKPAEQPPATSP